MFVPHSIDLAFVFKTSRVCAEKDFYANNNIFKMSERKSVTREDIFKGMYGQ